jgi:mannose-6-phosphate isomerase-like protein (cupin superfamily)
MFLEEKNENKGLESVAFGHHGHTGRVLTLNPEEVRDFIDFATKRLPFDREAVAPDGSDVRTLLELRGGGMAHFALGPGETSASVLHRTVGEIWYFLSGRGEMWRRNVSREEVVPVGPEVCVTIPVGTSFQFRSLGTEPLTAVAVTMPPWPGEGEAVEVEGKWTPTVPRR